jgi:hypothetical protein
LPQKSDPSAIRTFEAKPVANEFPAAFDPAAARGRIALIAPSVYSVDAVSGAQKERSAHSQKRSN